MVGPVQAADRALDSSSRLLNSLQVKPLGMMLALPVWFIQFLPLRHLNHADCPRNKCHEIKVGELIYFLYSFFPFQGVPKVFVLAQFALVQNTIGLEHEKTQAKESAPHSLST